MDKQIDLHPANVVLFSNKKNRGIKAMKRYGGTMHAYCWLNETLWKDGVVPTMWLSKKNDKTVRTIKKKKIRGCQELQAGVGNE